VQWQRRHLGAADQKVVAGESLAKNGLRRRAV